MIILYVAIRLCADVTGVRTVSTRLKEAEARFAGYITRDDCSAPVRGADPLRQKRAHAQRPASRADRRLDPRIWLHQPGADRRRGRHYRRQRPGARRACARPRRGAVHRPGAPHAGAAPRLCARRQQAGAQRRLGSRDALARNWRAGRSGFDLSLTGFDEFELGELFAERTQCRTDPDDAPEPPAHPVAEPGDLWVLGRHRLLCGDSTVATDVARVLGGVGPHLMVTDPPYGVNYDPAWRNQAGRSNNGTTRRIAAGTVIKPIGARAVGKVVNDDRADWREEIGRASGR